MKYSKLTYKLSLTFIVSTIMKKKTLEEIELYYDKKMLKIFKNDFKQFVRFSMHGGYYCMLFVEDNSNDRINKIISFMEKNKKKFPKIKELAVTRILKYE